MKSVAWFMAGVVLFVLLAAWACRAADSNLIYAESMTTMDNCPRCDRVKALVKESGVRVQERESESAKAPYFPCVVYSDGHKDAGDRVIHKECVFRDPFRIVKLKQKEEK